jgi:hypothetical protein
MIKGAWETPTRILTGSLSRHVGNQHKTSSLYVRSSGKLLNITGRAIRKAITAGRIKAVLSDARRYAISAEEVERYKARPGKPQLAAA